MAGILSISRADDQMDAFGTRNNSTTPVAPNNSKATTATYLSEESLTFPGMTGVASIFVAIYSKVTDTSPGDVVVLGSAVIIGTALTIMGLLDPDRKDKGRYATFVQIVIGIFNTALLAAAVLGVSTLTAPEQGPNG